MSNILTPSILTNTQKTLVIANKLKVSENILKSNRLDYLISKAKMENLESIPLEALSNMLAALDYDYIISLERSSKKLRENIRNVASDILLDKLLEKYGLTKQELPNELIQNLTYDDIKRLENNETFQLILTQKWLRSLNINYDLDQLRTLEELELDDNEIVDISQLKTLTNLQYLYLDNNDIVDVSPLKNLTNLRDLILDNNQISDISPLEKLTKLERLRLSGNYIVNISQLKTLTNLKDLNLDNNKIVNVIPLSTLTDLQNLYLNNNDIVDVSPLSALINLQDLHLSQNKIVYVSPLEKLTKLQTLYLSFNYQIDIIELKNLQRSLSNTKLFL